MKRLFCILCAALMLFGCTAKQADPAANGEPNATAEPTIDDEPIGVIVSIDPEVPDISGYKDFLSVLSAKLVDGTQNRNLSPISVYLALAMTAEGAKGDTQAAMLKLLGCESLEELRGVCGAILNDLPVDTEDSTLTFANSIWLAERGEKLQFGEDFLKALADIYRSEANAVRFGTDETAQQIADWITAHTGGKIKISPDALQFNPDTVAVLINTIYLKDAWCDEFYEGATQPGTFKGLSGDLTVDYMNRTDRDVMIVKGDGYLRYSLPLMRVGRMTFILPDEGTPLSDLLGSPEKLKKLLHDGQPIRADVSVKLPKFKFQDKLELDEVLKSLGMEIAFSERADFTAMVKSNAVISRVLQESYVGVDEKGVEAAAYTMVVMAKGCALYEEELPKIDFHLTRPFLYVIESYDGTVFFIGTVTEPTIAE